MLIINSIFYLDFLVFGIFASLLISEIMGSIILLLWWEKYRKPVLQYIVPIWEVTGTFGAFWVVLSDFAFPSILIPLAELYSGAIMIFLILFVARNSTITFGEFIIKKGWLDERKLYSGYALSSILIGVVVLYVLSGVIGGYGVSLGPVNVNAMTWISKPADLVFLIGAVILMIGLAPVFYGATEMAKFSVIFTAIGLIVSSVSLYLYEGSALSYLVIIPICLTILPAIFFNIRQLVSIVTNKLVFISWLSIDIFSLNFLVYPNAFGQSVPVDALTTSGPMTAAYFDITLVGGIILAVLIALYAIAVSRKNKMAISEV